MNDQSDTANTSKRPKLLCLEGLPSISGGQAVLVSLTQKLHDCYDLVALLPGEGLLAVALRNQGVICYFAPMGHYSLVRKTSRDVLNLVVRLPWLIIVAWLLIRKEHIDLVYANSARTFIWGSVAATLAGKPIIWHHHGVLSDKKTETILNMIGQWKSVRRIITVSDEGAQFSSLEAKSVIIPTGIDTERFQPNPNARTRIRSEFDIPEIAPVVGIIGDLIPLKHQDILMKAAHKCPPNIYFLIVGTTRPDDLESAHYAAELHKLKTINTLFTGQRSDIPDILNALDILVIASKSETGPLVLLEALATGLTVISTPVGQAPELLDPEALYPIGDIDKLATCLHDGLNDEEKRQTTAIKARSLAENTLDFEHFYSRVQAEIEHQLPNKYA